MIRTTNVLDRDVAYVLGAGAGDVALTVTAHVVFYALRWRFFWLMAFSRRLTDIARGWVLLSR